MAIVEDKVLEFYRRALLGTGYISKSKMNDQDEYMEMIVKCCFIKAWGTMATKTPKGFRADIKEDMLKFLKGEIKDIQDKIKTTTNKSEFFNSFIKGNWTCGLVQKVYNVFWKYIYTFKRELKLSKKIFRDCDCPIDNYILEKIKNDKNITCDKSKIKGKSPNYKYGVNCWSKLDESDYKELQDMIPTTPKLDYDFDNWG